MYGSPITKTITEGITKAIVPSNSVAPPPFSPLDIADIGVWFDAADASTISHTAGSVSEWRDKSPAAIIASQATATNQPTTGTRTINGLNAIDFDGSDDGMSLSSGANSLFAQPVTYFFAGATDTFAGRIILGQNEASRHCYIRSTASSGNKFQYMRSGGQTNSAEQVSDTNPHIVLGYDDGATLFLSIDGNAPVSGVAAPSNQTLTVPQLSRIAASFDGAMGEIIIYKRNLSTAEKNQVLAYLSAKWGISVGTLS